MTHLLFMKDLANNYEKMMLKFLFRNAEMFYKFINIYFMEAIIKRYRLKQ